MVEEVQQEKEMTMAVREYLEKKISTARLRLKRIEPNPNY